MEDQAFYVERKHQCKPPLLRMWKEKAQQGTTENIDLHCQGLFQMEIAEQGRFWKWRQSQMLNYLMAEWAHQANNSLLFDSWS